MSEADSKSPSSGKPAKAFSCVRCFERKVKCDKQHPCSGCVRSGVDCEFRVPPPPRRKKKRTKEEILNERLNQYEQILQEKGINLSSVPSNNNSAKETRSERNGSVAHAKGASGPPTASAQSDSDPRSFVAAKLIWEEGKSRFTENHLWTRVAEEMRNEQGVIHESSSEEEDDEEDEHEVNAPEDNIEFSLGFTPASWSTKNLHPPPEHISVLWQIFLENVNPFSMMVHRPTMYASIQKAILNLEHVPRSLEVLMFAIYTAALVSMEERDVDETFGESRHAMLTRYRGATKAALSRAKFMGTSNILVLQAFVLHLLSMRDVYDGRTLWTLSGVALRIAEGMGLHKDGTILGLPPFETELRRRTWYQITALDYRSAELSGSTKFNLAGLDRINTKPPLNINDEDIWPEMTEPPVPRQRITDMILCCLRYEFGSFWINRYKENQGPRKASVWDNYKSGDSMQEVDSAINDLESLLEEKYVRFCDPSVPVQLMASVVARTAPNAMRMMAHHPRRWASDSEIPESERKLLWNICMRTLESYTMAVTSKSLRRFTWHTAFYFQWQSLIYLLDCIRADPLMPGADEAWKGIGEVFDIHPNFITDTKKAIHVAVGNLCLKAYAAREQAFKREGRFLPARPPKHIQNLRKQREEALAKQAERKAKAQARTKMKSDLKPTPSNDLINMMGFEAASSKSSSAAALYPTPASQPHRPLQVPQQLPLPPLQAPTDQQQLQGQQAAPFWFDNFNNMSALSGSNDVDWMLMQDPIAEQGNQMDWSRWDTLLLDDGGGSGTFGNSMQPALWQ